MTVWIWAKFYQFRHFCKPILAILKHFQQFWTEICLEGQNEILGASYLTNSVSNKYNFETRQDASKTSFHLWYLLTHPSLIRDVNQAGRARAKNTSLSLDLLFSQRLCRSADGLVMVYFSQSIDPRVAGGRAKFCVIVKTFIAYVLIKNKNIAWVIFTQKSQNSSLLAAKLFLYECCQRVVWKPH